MFGRDEQKPGETETIIGPSVKVDGKFVGKGSVIVHGQVAGSLRTTEDLHVAAGAIVRATVDAKNIMVAGEIHGSVKAKERLELSETAKIYGDVEAKTITIGAGAILNGKCTMLGQSQPEAKDDIEGQASNMKQMKGNRKMEIAA